MAEPESMQARKAALLLHGLSPAVRQQVLARLDLAERVRLNPLLAELSELGLSQSLGHQLQHDLPSQPSGSASVAGALTGLEQVERLKADDVLRGLQPCAAATVAQLLRPKAWPWKADVLARMPQPQRGEVMECLRSDSVQLAPAVLALFCERLCHHASLVQVALPPARPLNDPPPARTGMKSRLWRLTAWIR